VMLAGTNVTLGTASIISGAAARHADAAAYHPIVYRNSYVRIAEGVPMDSHHRSIAKAISYRVLGSLATAFIFFVLSGDAKLSVGAGALDSILKVALYFLHERVWNNVDFGREKPPEYEI
jgi:uncharacterized membrane protein